MRKIQPSNIETGIHHICESFLVRAGWTERSNDLGKPGHIVTLPFQHVRDFDECPFQVSLINYQGRGKANHIVMGFFG